MNPPVPLNPPPGAIPAIAEVRYSLAQILSELKTERTASGFAMEKLDQEEIARLFKSSRRGHLHQ